MLIDLHWVQALSLYQSSRWPPDLKSYCPSGSKKGTFSLKNSQQANPLHVPQWGPY